jgi:hypothetical protein
MAFLSNYAHSDVELRLYYYSPSTIAEHNLRYDTHCHRSDWDFKYRYSEYTMFGYINQATCLYRVHTTNVTLLTNRQKRKESLAICREKAIKSVSFSRCSLETRYYVFYDLLIDILAGYPEKQDDVLHWQTFLALPERERAKLLRLMASQAISEGSDQKYIRRWLQESQKISGGEIKSIFLAYLYRISPKLCKSILQIKRLSHEKTVDTSPFGNLN